MKKLIAGDIIPGEGISILKLGMSKEEVFQVIGNEYETDDWGHLYIENAAIIFNKQGNVRILSVFDDFEGKFMGKIGIGNTLEEIGERIGEYKEIYETDFLYTLTEYPGITFQLDDEGEEIETEEEKRKLPVVEITVFDTKDVENDIYVHIEGAEDDAAEKPEENKKSFWRKILEKFQR